MKSLGMELYRSELNTPRITKLGRILSFLVNAIQGNVFIVNAILGKVKSSIDGFWEGDEEAE